MMFETSKRIVTFLSLIFLEWDPSQISTFIYSEMRSIEHTLSKQ